jgi:membrane protease YdiL (CAAX protease family)
MTGRTRFGSKGPTEATWLGAHPIAGSIVITVLTGLGLQLTHLIDFEERMSAVVGWTLRLRFIDFGFRMVLGALVVLILLPLLFGYLQRRPWFLRYLRHLRLTSGHTPRLTVAATAASMTILVALVIGLGAYLGVLEFNPDSWSEDSRWFVVILTLVPGIWEELAFRGLMLANLQQRYGPWAAIVITATLFGLMHLTDLVIQEPSEVVFEVIMATALGIAWGYLTAKTESVAPAMILHYSVNVLIELAVEPELTDTASAAIFGSVTIAYPVLTIITVWSLARLMARRPALIAAQYPGGARPD